MGYSWGGLLALLYALEHPGGSERLALVSPAPAWRAAREEFEGVFARPEPRSRVPGGAGGSSARAGSGSAIPPRFQQRIFELSVAPYFFDPARARELTPFRVTGRTQQEVWQSLGDYDLRPRLPALRASPSLVLHGEDDAIPIEAARTAAGLIGAAFHPLPRCGHVPYVEAFEAFRSAGRRLPLTCGMPDRRWPDPPRSTWSSRSSAETVFPLVRAALERDRPASPPTATPSCWSPRWSRCCTTCGRRKGLGEGMDQLVALAHHAYLLWNAGALTLPIDGRPPHRPARRAPAPASPALGEPPRAFYAQLLDRQVWARVIDDEAAEPMDGCFVHPANGGLRVLGIFGLRPDREGFSAVETAGPRPQGLERARRHAAVLPGARGRRRRQACSRWSGAEELLELGWRTRALASELSAAPG